MFFFSIKFDKLKIEKDKIVFYPYVIAFKDISNEYKECRKKGKKLAKIPFLTNSYYYYLLLIPSQKYNNNPISCKVELISYSNLINLAKDRRDILIILMRKKQEISVNLF